MKKNPTLSAGQSGAEARVLKRSSPIPLYHQVATQLRTDLLAGNDSAGTAYFSDRELIRRFGVSLLTARQAMLELVNEGLLERRQGSGTFLSRKLEKVRVAEAPAKARTILFTGWSPAALSGWDAMYFREIFQGIQSEVNASGLRLAFDDLEAVAPAQIATEARARGICGVLALIGTNVRNRCAQLAEGGLPVVTINFDEGRFPSVLPDNYLGGRIAVEHLLKLGHRRLAHINSGETELHWTEVKRAYRDVLAEAGMTLKANPILESKGGGGSIEAGYELAQQLGQSTRKPSAIFAGNDLMAIGAMKFLRDHGVAVPGDVSIVGFDDIEAAAVWSPALTTIGLDRIAMGRSAVKLLTDSTPGVQLGADAKFEPKKMAVRLVERATTSVPK